MEKPIAVVYPVKQEEKEWQVPETSRETAPVCEGGPNNVPNDSAEQFDATITFQLTHNLSHHQLHTLIRLVQRRYVDLHVNFCR